VRISRLELTRLGLDVGRGPEHEEAVARYLVDHLWLEAGALLCTAHNLRPVTADEGWVAIRWDLACPPSGPRQIATDLLLAVAPSHLHFARLRQPDVGIRERVLSEALPRWAVDATGDSAAGSEAAPSSFSAYLALGVEHILTGWDHLAFVIALLLLAGSLREVAGLVTGFTIAHSVTLAVAVLGYARPEPAAVEAVIGFSVALVALENGWLLAGRPRSIPIATALALAIVAVGSLFGGASLSPLVILGLALFSLCHFGLIAHSNHASRIRAALAFAFGLVHGFGFAGILAELALPTARLVPALVGFNVGVELGQLGVVALVWPLLRIAMRGEGRAHRLAAELGTAAVCGVGIFWFVARTFGSG